MSSSILSATVRFGKSSIFFHPHWLLSRSGKTYPIAMAALTLETNSKPKKAIHLADFVQLLTISVLCCPAGTGIWMEILSGDRKITAPEIIIEFFSWTWRSLSGDAEGSGLRFFCGYLILSPGRSFTLLKMAPGTQVKYAILTQANSIVVEIGRAHV